MGTKMQRSLILLCAALAISACDKIPDAAYHPRGTPESLLDASTERVSIQLSDRSSLQELSYWLDQEQPTRAELQCVDGDLLCSAASGTLAQFNVPTTRAPGNNSVHLVYERVVARDCDNRFIDAVHNPYNLNHPTFGCSLAANIVQHATDKRQFTSPALLPNMDGRRVYHVQRAAAQGNTYAPRNINTDFQPITNSVSQ
jgi:hypothetical protein